MGHQQEFVYNYDNKFTLTAALPVPLPIHMTPREYAFRFMSAHNLPCYVEEDLTNAICDFISRQTDVYHKERNEEAIRPIVSDLVDIEKLANTWSDLFQDEHAVYSIPEEITNETVFSEVYHKLVHSPGLDTLLSLEHTFAMAMDDVVAQRDTDLTQLEAKQQEEMERAVSNVGISTSDVMVNALAVQHFEDTQLKESKWESEIGVLRSTQKRDYMDWIVKVHEEYQTTGKIDIFRHQSPSQGEVGVEGDWPSHRMEESFTIHLGTQLKQMHNLRLLSANVLDLCRYKSSEIGVDPLRLQTAMSLYSNSLSGLVLLVDNRISSYTGIKREFARVCQRSTEFHFPEIDDQLETVREQAENVINWRLANTSNFDYSPVFSPIKTNSPTDVQSIQSPHTTKLHPGDLYVTRHSNLSGNHVVFHVVSDDSLRAMDMSSRHPVILGLRNVLKMTCMFDIATITLPLFLVHEMSEEMTISWCMKRAELVYKCVKGFMIEMASWGGIENRTVQFLIPKGISEDLFSNLAALLPSIFRVSNPLVVKST